MALSAGPNWWQAWASPALAGGMVWALHSLKSTWKYGLMLWALCIHKRLCLKNQIITYKCFQMCVHYTNYYQSSLLTLHIRLVHAFITRRITTVASLLMFHMRLVRTFITWRITRVVYWCSFLRLAHMFITWRITMAVTDTCNMWECSDG